MRLNAPIIEVLDAAVAAVAHTIVAPKLPIIGQHPINIKVAGRRVADGIRGVGAVPERFVCVGVAPHLF